MEQQDIDKFVNTIQDRKFVKDATDIKQALLHAFTQTDLTNAIKNATNAMKRFGYIARNSLPLQ